jgi:hypothetical protein
MNVSARLLARPGRPLPATPGILFARELEQPFSRETARREHISRSVEQADDPDVGVAVGGADLIGQRAADAPESQKHHIGAGHGHGPAAADLRQLKGRVYPAHGLGGSLSYRERADPPDDPARGHAIDPGRGERRKHCAAIPGAPAAFANDAMTATRAR